LTNDIDGNPTSIMDGGNPAFNKSIRLKIVGEISNCYVNAISLIFRKMIGTIKWL